MTRGGKKHGLKGGRGSQSKAIKVNQRGAQWEKKESEGKNRSSVNRSVVFECVECVECEECEILGRNLLWCFVLFCFYSFCVTFDL